MPEFHLSGFPLQVSQPRPKVGATITSGRSSAELTLWKLCTPGALRCQFSSHISYCYWLSGTPLCLCCPFCSQICVYTDKKRATFKCVPTCSITEPTNPLLAATDRPSCWKFYTYLHPMTWAQCRGFTFIEGLDFKGRDLQHKAYDHSITLAAVQSKDWDLRVAWLRNWTISSLLSEGRRRRHPSTMSAATSHQGQTFQIR